jgi:ribA/ribD-fused uncharacterized protein
VSMFEEEAPSSRIEFYRSSGPYGCFSNLYMAEVDFEGRRFPCSEYAYQFAKPNKPAITEWLMAAPTPRLCASAAHGLLRYDVVSDWSTLKFSRMRAVLLAKFGQHPRLAHVLLSTGDALLVEASRTDATWGLGANGKGSNMLGRMLMELRSSIQARIAAGAEGPEEALLQLTLAWYQSSSPHAPADYRPAAAEVLREVGMVPSSSALRFLAKEAPPLAAGCATPLR